MIIGYPGSWRGSTTLFSHNKVFRGALQHYQVEQADQVDALIGLLRETVLAYQSEGSAEARLAAIAALLGPDGDDIVMRCEAHAALAGNNHFLFLARFYHPRRAVLMQALANLNLRSTSQDTSVIEAIAFMLTHRNHRRSELTVAAHERLPDGSERVVPSLDLSFIADKWWPLVTGQRAREKPVTTVDRRYFELCVMTQVMLDLKSGDLYVPDSEEFGDYRQQLVSWEDYAREMTAYGEQAGVPTEGKTFVARLQTELETAAHHADARFPTNEDLRIEKGVPILKRLRAKPDNHDDAKRLERLLDEQIEPINIIDALIDTEYWLRWTRHFGPLSSFEAKLDHPAERYLVTAFCYGCNLGPTQTARAMTGVDRRHLAFVNQRHVTEEKLNEAIATVVNAYARIGLQARWGSGRTASADGTQWELYPQNLISQYHIRYGGYGGLGYYLVADSYVALFSRFIACGTYEGYHILDFNRPLSKPD
ncbi:MAG: Tn3 family transposase [Candidatus Competibacter sp.]